MGLPTPSDPWIVVTGTAKPDAEARQRIRSHVMRGKNSRGAKRARKLVVSQSSGQDAAVEWIMTTPRKVALDFSHWGVDLSPHEHELLHQALTVLKPPTPPVADILHGDDGSGLMYCFDSLFQVPALLNAVLFTAQSYRDIVLNREPELSNHSRQLFATTLHHLQDQLKDEKQSLSDSTVSVVTTLAMASFFVMDLHTTEQHIVGLNRLLLTRGGLKAIGFGNLVGKKAHRIDFGLSLATGRPMRLIEHIDDSTLAPHLALPPAELLPLGVGLDSTLLDCWSEVRSFAQAANQSLTRRKKLPPAILSNLTEVVPSKLLSLQLDPTSPSELLRLCMLAILKSVVTPYPGMSRVLQYLCGSLKANLLSVFATIATGALPVLLWGLFIAAITLFEDFDREWIQKVIREVALRLKVHSWDAAKEVVSRFIWIDSLYDETALQLWFDWVEFG